MSNVQLSSAAMERLVARRTFPLHKRTGACRSLFGPVDHDELNREMKAKLREISERDQQRWNFNFEANAPLDGDYQWEELPLDTTPGFYQDKRSSVPPTPVKQRPSADSAAEALERLSAPESSSSGGGSSSSSPAEVNQENRLVELNSGRAAHRRVPCVRRRRPAAPSDNSHITDFFSVKRKRAVDSCHLSKSPIPVEQTPRKRIR
ncbi:cyclin-dependent kinase inhibitor 1C-like [Synchiropus splendidus]|uniref:cyclin-dependent kinase inhibitor 1C-like n=1 Tax=Synchiropus splendidus TaxID=270530 RepID=UPI00237D55B0|nr:cyclin-dependent kinase inhibitor 1C-like [Synchiropus splendidus]XP_053741882.1 cyclin-dependent kinase inhibitor 1C-like [Synchiropus splendidus]